MKSGLDAMPLFLLFRRSVKVTKNSYRCCCQISPIYLDPQRSMQWHQLRPLSRLLEGPPNVNLKCSLLSFLNYWHYFSCWILTNYSNQFHCQDEVVEIWPLDCHSRSFSDPRNILECTVVTISKKKCLQLIVVSEIEMATFYKYSIS